ncbi:MAG: hypothetical protein RR310_06955 [Eubacterium sp.]
MQKILEKAAAEGWVHLPKGIACGNREDFIREGEQLSVTLQPISYQTANMTPAQLAVAMEAEELYLDNDPRVQKIRDLPFKDQVALIGIEHEIFLMICQE